MAWLPLVVLLPGLAAPAPPGALPAAALAHWRAGAATLNSTATLTATVSANTAVAVASGNNSIQGGALANAAGLPVVIQNSGANVLIQNATVINLHLE
ncbi:hypothetical protein [Massilia sp. TS11]|uniref:hypothetical protein n=1 Tax=Massilia sp. TS11 TaxID=2908003 RepID=UPI001EDC9107|nr:hypothetical protein [Massilia sp. TS11]MCG2585740.1 hypothetical protein [Massilia sp. TS11]